MGNVKQKTRIFTSEQVSPGHPDKLADQISDAFVDAYYNLDNSTDTRVAVETLLKGNMVVIAGEVSCKSEEKVDHEDIVRKVLKRNRYTKEISPDFNDENVIILDLISEQSKDIATCVNATHTKEIGAGDQGIMFGYAVNEAPDKTGWCHYLSRLLVFHLYRKFIIKDNCAKYRPDFKVQVTCEYSEGKVAIKVVNVSISHSKDVSLLEVRNEIFDYVLRVLKNEIEYGSIKGHSMLNGDGDILTLDDIKITVNANGPFTVFGPIADAGVTGRKIVCDQYGGYAPVGGGAFSGKDLTKIDRTAAYTAKIISDLMLDEIPDAYSVQTNVSYIIGNPQPVSVDFICTFNDGSVEHYSGDESDKEMLSMKEMLSSEMKDLLSGNYSKLSAGCHFGDYDGTVIFDGVE